MKKVMIFLTDGFEEIEAIANIDILRRAGIDVLTVSITSDSKVTGGHGIPVIADAMFMDINTSETNMLIIPGGTVKYNEHEGLKKMLADFAAKGGYLAAICAAPMVLGGLGLLRGKKATVYPGFEQYLEGAEFIKQAVVTDGKIITGRGPGFAIDFALEVVRVLCGDAKYDDVATGLLVK